MTDVLWHQRTYEVALFYGHDREWWEKAVHYFRAANPDYSLPKSFLPARFWRDAVAAEHALFESYHALNILEFWEKHPSQAEMLLP